MRALSLLLVFVALLLASCQPAGPTTAVIETSMGNITVELNESTPRHTENFIKLANEDFYVGTLFHRIIPNFMIQGGDPMSVDAAPNAPLGGGGPGYLIDEEIGAPHLAGALAAARTQNPEKASSGSQFYIVTGTPQSDATLDQIERIKGIKYNDAQRAAYREQGGRPDLDMDYTVFGQVTEGMDVVRAIAQVERNPADRPTTDVVIRSVTIQ